MIVDPKGRVLSKVPYDTHGIAIADIDPDMALNKSIYTGNDKIADRRSETYGIMSEPYFNTPVAKIADVPIVPSQSISKIAAVQMHVTNESTVDDVFDMIDHAAKLGIKVITLPEYAFSTHWLPNADEAAQLSNAAPDYILRAAVIAKKYSCLIAIPTLEKTSRGIFITTYLIGPDGKNIGKYRKTHLTVEERIWAVAGDEYPVFDTPFGRIGVMSGYDAVFPETSRCLGIAAADIILWPASLREPFERELIAVPRAEDNRVAVVLANRVDCPYPGGSLVIPPTGFPLWDINKAAPRMLKLGAVMPKHIDLAVCRQKQMIPKVDMFANRLVETYDPIITF